MLIYSFEPLRSISYASNSNTELIRDKRSSCEPLHCHDYYEMIYIYDGEAVHNINNVSYKLIAGSLVLLTPNDSHSIVATSEFSSINICFIERKGLTNLPAQGLKTPVATLDEQSRIEIESLLYLAEQELNRKDSFTDGAIDRCLDWMLLLFRRNNETFLRINTQWTVLLSKIAENFSTITLEEAAATIGVSVSHFCRIFKRDFSMTFHAYLNVIRMRQAKNLLINSNEPIAVIAEKVGYENNPCRFYSNFKAIVGMTPSDFRKSFRRSSATAKNPTRSFIPEPKEVWPEHFTPYSENDTAGTKEGKKLNKNGK